MTDVSAGALVAGAGELKAVADLARDGLPSSELPEDGFEALFFEAANPEQVVDGPPVGEIVGVEGVGEVHDAAPLSVFAAAGLTPQDAVVPQGAVAPDAATEKSADGLQPVFNDGPLAGGAKSPTPLVAPAASGDEAFRPQFPFLPADAPSSSSVPGQAHAAGAPIVQDGSMPTIEQPRKWQTELPEEFRSVSRSLEGGAVPKGGDLGGVRSEGGLVLPASSNSVAQVSGKPPQEMVQAPVQAIAPVESEVSRPEQVRPVVGGQGFGAEADPLGSEQGKRSDGSSLPAATAAGSLLRKPGVGASSVPGQVVPQTGDADLSQLSAEAGRGHETSPNRLQAQSDMGAEPPKAAASQAKAGDAPVQSSAGGSGAVIGEIVLGGGHQVAQSGDVKLSLADMAFGTEFSSNLRGGEMQGAARTEGLQTPNQAQSAQVATQVAVEIARNLKNAQTRFQMRFDPPELGRVDVNMKVASDGSVQAHLIVERPETLDMFMRDQRGLERALEAAGLSADSSNLQFSLKKDGGEEFASGDQQNQRGQEKSQQSGDDAENEDFVPHDVARMTLAAQRGGLDLKV